MSLKIYSHRGWVTPNRKLSINLRNMGACCRYNIILILYKRFYQYIHKKTIVKYSNIKYIYRLLLNNKQNRVGIYNLKLQTVC